MLSPSKEVLAKSDELNINKFKPQLTLVNAREIEQR